MLSSMFNCAIQTKRKGIRASTIIVFVSNSTHNMRGVFQTEKKKLCLPQAVNNIKADKYRIDGEDREKMSRMIKMMIGHTMVI